MTLGVRKVAKDFCKVDNSMGLGAEYRLVSHRLFMESDTEPLCNHLVWCRCKTIAHHRLTFVKRTLSFLHSACSFPGYRPLEPCIVAFVLQILAGGYHWHPIRLSAVFCIEHLHV